MPDPQIQSDLLNLQALISQAEAMAGSARSQASIPVTANAPVTGLIMMAEALDAQQKALKKIHKLLEKMA